MMYTKKASSLFYPYSYIQSFFFCKKVNLIQLLSDVLTQVDSKPIQVAEEKYLSVKSGLQIFQVIVETNRLLIYDL